MRSYPELRPSGWDGLVAALVAALAVLCAAVTWTAPAEDSGSLTAVITVDGTEVERIPLDGETEQTVRGNGYTLHVVVTETEVFVASSDCPSQDCVETAPISQPGRSIVCLPARVIIQLEGGAASPDVDAVIG